MDSENWPDLVQAAIAKSGLPYQVVSCGCKRNGSAWSATIQHQRTRALREVALLAGVVASEEMRNEIIHQMRAFNVAVPSACPKGHLSLVQLERDELTRLLADGTLTLYCDVCDEFREPSAGELAAIAQLLAEQPAA